MRTIDADAILKRAEESFKNAGLHGEDYRKFKKWLRTAPTIDAVEVVRCKDCVYLNRKEAYGDEWKECTHYPQHHIRLDDFCSYGERKEDADLGYGENWKEFKGKACEEAIKAIKMGDD